MRRRWQRIGIEQSDSVGTEGNTALPVAEVVVRAGQTRIRVHKLHGLAVEDVGSEQFTEVARAHQRRWNLLLREIVVVVPRPFLSNQEEELLMILVEVARNEEGAIQVPAKLVVVEALPLGTRVVAGPGVGVQGSIAEVLEDAAVKVARTALGNHTDLAA